MGGLSLWHWLIVLVVVVLVFGTKRLRNVGQDLGEAVKGFKKGVRDEDRPAGSLGDESRRHDTPDAVRPAEGTPDDRAPADSSPGAPRDAGRDERSGPR